MITGIWAHRGASAYAPENTMEAFMLARQMGADGIELDIHQTKDGHLVVIHDETVDRCSNGHGRVIDHTLSDLLKLDFSKGWVEYSNLRIPTLEQVLEFIKSTNMTLNIEIKSDVVIYKGIEEKALLLVRQTGLMDRVIYSSFNHYSLKMLKKLDPTAKAGILYVEAMVDPHCYARHLRMEAIHPYFPTLMIPGNIEACKKAGIKIHPWTVNEPEHMKWMFEKEVDAIITNWPDRAIKLRKTMQR